jgi:hypothetical protein
MHKNAQLNPGNFPRKAPPNGAIPCSDPLQLQALMFVPLNPFRPRPRSRCAKMLNRPDTPERVLFMGL